MLDAPDCVLAALSSSLSWFTGLQPASLRLRLALPVSGHRPSTPFPCKHVDNHAHGNSSGGDDDDIDNIYKSHIRACSVYVPLMMVYGKKS